MAFFNGKKGWLIYTRDCSLSIICSFTQETVHGLRDLSKFRASAHFPVQ